MVKVTTALQVKVDTVIIEEKSSSHAEKTTRVNVPSNFTNATN